MKKHRYSLSIHISSLFLALTTLIGVILILVSYQHSQQLLLGSAKAVSQENSQKLQSEFQRSTAPIFSALDFMANSSFVHNDKPIYEEARWLSSLKMTFERNPHLVALYFGANNGDFTMIRPLFTEDARKRFEAPENARLFVNQTKTDGTNDTYFLDKDFQEVGFHKTLDNQYDPRLRPWYKSAEADGKIRITEPYFFFFLKTFGITLSRASNDGSHVIGADFTLGSLSDHLATLGTAEHSKLVIFDSQFRLLAQHNTDLSLSDDAKTIEGKLHNSVFGSVAGRISSQTLYETQNYDDEDWSVTLTPINLSEHVQVRLAEANLQKELLKDLISMRNEQVSIAIGLLLISYVLVWFISQRLARPLVHLVEQTRNITRFDFKKTRYPRTMIRELGDLTQSIQLMEHTLTDLLKLLRETASNSQFDVLAKTIARQSYMITKAETIQLYTFDQQDLSFSVVTNHAIIPFKIDLNQLIADTPWFMSELRSGNTIHLHREDNWLRKYHKQIYNSDLYFFPLLNRDRQLVGLLNLGYERAISQSQLDKHAFLRELLSFAEIAKDNIDKMQQQKDMLNSFVELIASSIDTKSPYTGGHCQRVPELTKMLAKAAVDDKQYFANFAMNNEQWEELNLAAWLHDCGKITTPEYVIDKATKLETIYDRIHEVRMRFELLKSEAEVEYWQQMAQGGDEKALKQALTQRHQQLDDDFAFIAQCNVGSEAMSEEAVKRLNSIATQQWKRTIDDSLGVSWMEAAQHGYSGELPVMEPLLADKPHHKVPWAKDEHRYQHGDQFTLTPNEYRFNRGELYNLSVRYGTLTEEERFIINDHIVQTILMLNKLPYPKHLQQVPEIAGNHHERLDGTGYPRGLNEQQLSLPAKMMAIADVFEALTSADRPYKKAKKLSEAINIMTKMATSGHLDPKLYLLFLEQDVYLEYASRFLRPEQCNNVEKSDHVRQIKSYLNTPF
ncbi:HD domain-containing phosphohydrolase [Vibrio tritonius]|uniref:HD domain-containing phosphohydrolase n=1 Tax=Vibrio tritonius TaxID=1435069 RepID=UPI000837EFA3|nr:HD domain-containing phosphohydrolase [Vibrio tritonius]